MKKISLIAAIIMILVVIGIIVINSREADTEVTKNTTKVGVILNGEIEDHSWSQSHYEGLEATSKSLNLEMIYKENVPESEEAIDDMEELIDQGCEIIVCNSFGFGDAEMAVAADHPDIYFFHATGVNETSNLSTYFGRIYQMRYLSGIVAGLQTDSNEIGYIAAFPISEVNRGINAFTLGVKKVNPDATVYVEWSNSWIGDEDAENATASLLDKHPNIDVLTVHVDSLAVYKYAEENDIWSIGYNIDNSNLFPNSFLTAPIWHWESFYSPRILECLQDKFVSKHYWEGVESGIIELAPLTDNVKPGTAEIVSEEMDKLQSGTFDVFYGPIKDNEGNIQVGEGENLSDDAMLNDFFWYVEGVVVENAE